MIVKVEGGSLDIQPNGDIICYNEAGTFLHILRDEGMSRKMRMASAVSVVAEGKVIPQVNIRERREVYVGGHSPVLVTNGRKKRR